MIYLFAVNIIVNVSVVSFAQKGNYAFYVKENTLRNIFYFLAMGNCSYYILVKPYEVSE